jgi:SAM-dependent methyltransferase
MNNYYIDNYTINPNPSHHNDIVFEDDYYQKEVYTFCADLMKKNNFNIVIDIGCGSGYKLIKYLKEYNTIGIETEPCYSMLCNKYPDRNWKLSGEIEKNFNDYPEIKTCDIIICSDVIEHIIDPDILVDYLLSFNSKYYIISTPCRYALCHHPSFNGKFKRSWFGPPINTCHVREWTMDEFKKYINNKFNILESFYCSNQPECQYHLLTKK